MGRKSFNKKLKKELGEHMECDFSTSALAVCGLEGCRAQSYRSLKKRRKKDRKPGGMRFWLKKNN